MRKLAWLTGSFSLGMACLYLGAPWALALLPLGALFFRENRPMRLALIVVGALVAAVWRTGYDALVKAPALAWDGRIQPLSGVVADWPRTTAGGSGGVTVEITSLPGLPVKAVYYGGPEILDWAPGDQVTLAAQWQTAGEGGGRNFDVYPSRGIFLVGFARGEAEVTRPAAPPITSWPAYACRWLQERAASLYPEGEAGLLTALLTGDRSHMPLGEYTALRRAGLAHVAAVSGMHMAFLASLAAALLGRSRRGAWMTLPILWFFAFMVGFTPSVVRAAVMETFLLLGPMAGRESDSPTSLAAALALLLAQNPYAVGSVSLQLSFAAVVGILCFSRRFIRWSWRRLPQSLPGAPRWALRGLLVTLGVTLGALAFTLPLSAWYFGAISLIAPLSALACLWAVELCFLLGLLSAFLPFLAWPVTALLRYFRWAYRGLAGLPYSTVNADGPYILLAFLFCYLLALLYFTLGGRRPALPLCGGVIALAAALLFTDLDYAAGPATLTVLDVGQGQCVLIRSGDRLMAVDCGGDAANAGDTAANYLASRGRHKLDLLLLTHYHADHANGAAELLERMEVDTIIAPVPEADDLLAQEIFDLAEEQGTHIRLLHDRDLLVPFGNGDLTVYAPLGAGQANESGLSLLYEVGGFSALFTGDMDETVEARLVKYGDLPDVDLLVAGHHGAKSSTSQLLLDAVKPETVAVSVGANRYGHPHPDTLARLERAGCQVCRTDLRGNLTIKVGERRGTDAP